MSQSQTHLSQALEEESKRENQYDEKGKYLISHKECLARIMQQCIPEYKDCSLDEIREEYIEGTPMVMTVPVHKNATNSEMIRGMNVEDTSINEGTVRYDIRFYALTPGKDQVEVIINVEIQNQKNVGYHLVKRAPVSYTHLPRRSSPAADLLGTPVRPRRLPKRVPWWRHRTGE